MPGIPGIKGERGAMGPPGVAPIIEVEGGGRVMTHHVKGEKGERGAPGPPGKSVQSSQSLQVGIYESR